MTNPKTADSRSVTTRSKPAAPAKADPPTPEKSTKDAPVAGDPPPPDPNVLLAQLVSLTQSINNLVQQNVEDDQEEENPPLSPEQTRVLFAYDFLGVVLGRRAPSLFQLSTVDVARNFGTLTFTNLGIAKVARIRGANNVVKTVPVTEGEPVYIDRDPNAIEDNVRIDSIVTFTSPGNVPVAIGPCKGPVGGIDGVD